MPSCRVLIPLPHRDFDPSEVAIAWQVLRDAGHRIAFATPAGLQASADPLMLSGEDYDALVLPGGHWARGMRQYPEDSQLQGFVADFFDADKPAAAICHGVVLAARSTSSRTGRSVLFGRKTTALTWQLEKSAYSMMRFIGRFWDPAYYRTYLEAGSEAPGFRGVQAEVSRALQSPADFRDVAKGEKHHFRKSSGLFRDSLKDSRAAWVVRDGRYVSARWPGDVHKFAATFAAVLAEVPSTKNSATG